jgi:peroxin-5
LTSSTPLAEFAAAQQAYAEREAANAHKVRGSRQAYRSMDHLLTGDRSMAGLWEDEDQVREQRERQQARSTSELQFQGDGGSVVEDDEMVERDEATMHMDTSVPLASQAWEEDFDASMISGGHGINAPRTSERELSAQQKEWDTLQNDWDNFEVTAAGFKPVASTSTTFGGYAFAQNNPYVQSTRHHALHSSSAASAYDSILQHEAAVQQRPRDPHAWLALGIKQQENEREEMAIKALQRALELDPEMGEAHLALAVSYTNENERAKAYEAIDKWIDTLAVSRYTREVDAYRDLFGKLPDGGSSARHEYLTGMLIRLAQSRTEIDGADVDAEVQIGLGVLFNTSEEYDKAGDCFESALSVRPDVRLSSAFVPRFR